MPGFGNVVQAQHYQRMKNEKKLPVSVERWEQQARLKLEDGPFWYVAGGAGAGDTMKANLESFQRWSITPRMFNDVDTRDMSVTILGQTFPYPLLLAPIGVQSIVHDDAEIASAKAAAEMNVPFITSSASSRSMEDIAKAIGDKPKWFQLYWGKDEDVTASMLKRAEQAGYSAIVITLDTQMLSWREEDLENAYLPFLQAEGIANYLSDPAFRSKLKKSPEEDVMGAVQYFLRIFSNASLTWKDLAFIREHTQLPIVLKGILHPGDAELAMYHGANGIIVSNHGGRQVSGAISALDALTEVSQVTQGRIPLLMDSGIRRGSDILKALALGASAVLIGRPYIYGLAVSGQKGVEEVIRNLLADFDLTMALSGKKSVSEIDRSLLTYR
ncbi:lactate 2-monooxygenase [Pueribacillus sp. YX66]|uniref:lactate 2-monooxygenase n=1 Tax=Pueribacillus sp. YX66 TaxID=3229242 RepID=UPI00358D4538